MDKGLRAKTAIIRLATLTAFLSTSCIYVGSHTEMSRCEKEVPLSAPLQAGSSFSATTSDGSITIRGLDTSECRTMAKVVAYARTQEAAEELVQQIDVRLEPAGDGLKVVVDRPPVIRDAHFSVSLDADLPTKTNLLLETSDGAVNITNVTGTVEAKTSDGSIEVDRLNGDVTLRTSNGEIRCSHLDAKTLHLHTSDGSIRLTDTTVGSCEAQTSDGGISLEEVRGDSLGLRTNDGSIRCRDIVASRLDCHTSDGAVEIAFAPETPKVLQVDATTSDGSISLTAPSGLSATIEAQTSDGSIHTNLPITVQGKIGKSLHGTIGDGEGRIYLKTNSGSITIR
jgi:DUF4097 and DUF4098 domain-containing protein YvlB